jgi:hypothetical protein
VVYAAFLFIFTALKRSHFDFTENIILISQDCSWNACDGGTAAGACEQWSQIPSF